MYHSTGAKMPSLVVHRDREDTIDLNSPSNTLLNGSIFQGASSYDCIDFRRSSGATCLNPNLNSITDEEIMDISGLLQDRTVMEKLRNLHIQAPSKPLAKIFSLMSPPQSSSVQLQIQSLTLLTDYEKSGCPNVTNFLDTCSLFDLRILHLKNCSLRWESLTARTSRLTRLFIDTSDQASQPTVTQLAALFAGNSALEEIELGLDVSTPEDPSPEAPNHISLPLLRRLTITGISGSYAQLLNHLTFSTLLKRVETEFCLHKVVTDLGLAEALASFLEKIFRARVPGKLALVITYLWGGGIHFSQPGDTEDFLVLSITSPDAKISDVISPLMIQDVVERLPIANIINSLWIEWYSDDCRQDFRRLFRTLSEVEELTIKQSHIKDIVQVLDSQSEDGDEPNPLLHLHTVRLENNQPYAGMASDLDRLRGRGIAVQELSRS